MLQARYMWLFIVITAGIAVFQTDAGAEEFKALRVAHAGGAINGKSYTNSYDALNRNFKRGFLYFELDFNFTIDNKLVCLHNWKNNFKDIFGFVPSKKPTLIMFKLMARHAAEFENCTLDGLVKWLRKHKNARIITNIKIRNLKGLKQIITTVPNAGDRIIPQIYYPGNYARVKDMGYRRIIWTLYRYQGSQEKVLSWAESFQGAFAITMTKQMAETSLPMELRKRKIPTYVHTVNNLKEAHYYVNTCQISEIYTDSMDPAPMNMLNFNTHFRPRAD